MFLYFGSKRLLPHSPTSPWLFKQLANLSTSIHSTHRK